MAVALRQVFHRDGALHVLPDESIRVLITPAFPGVVQRRKVADGVDDGLLINGMFTVTALPAAPRLSKVPGMQVKAEATSARWRRRIRGTVARGECLRAIGREGSAP